MLHSSTGLTPVVTELQSVLREMQNKVLVRTRRPWFEIQRDHWQPNGGIQNDEELRASFRHFLVDINAHDCRVLMKEYMRNGVFDSKRLADDMFPKTRPSDIIDYTHPMGKPEHQFINYQAPVDPPMSHPMPPRTQNMPLYHTAPQFNHPPSRPDVHRPSMRGPSKYYMTQNAKQQQEAMMEQAMHASTAVPAPRTRRTLVSRQTRPASSAIKVRKPPSSYTTTSDFYKRRTRTTSILPSVNTPNPDFFMRSRVSTR